MLYSRRDFGKLTAATLPAIKALGAINPAINSKVGGVQLGAITYSFRTIPDLDDVIKAMVQIGLGEAELMSDHAEGFAGAPRPQRPPRGPPPEGGRRQMAPEQREPSQPAARTRGEEVRKRRLC